MLFQDFSEAREVEGLVVLNEDQAEVEFAERELDVVHLSHFLSLGNFVVGVDVFEEVEATGLLL